MGWLDLTETIGGLLVARGRAAFEAIAAAETTKGSLTGTDGTAGVGIAETVGSTPGSVFISVIIGAEEAFS